METGVDEGGTQAGGLGKGRGVRSRYVYVLRCETYVKVGVTWNVQGRWANSACDNPFPVEILHTKELPAHLARHVESLTHARLYAHHHRGEWFTCSAAEAVEAIDWVLAQFQKWFPPDWLASPERVKSSVFKEACSRAYRHLKLLGSAASIQSLPSRGATP